MKHSARFVALAVALLVSGCEDRKDTHGATQLSGLTKTQEPEDEAAVLAYPLLTEPVMLHLSGDTYTVAQVAASMHGESIIYPPETHTVWDNLLPCRDTEDTFYLAGSIPFTASAANYPFPDTTLLPWLEQKGILELQRYPIKHIQPDDRLYGITRTYVCPVVGEKVRQYLPPERASADIHNGLDVPFMRREFVAWTYRNRYDTQLFGKGSVKVFAGTLTYKMVALIPGATPTTLGTASVKALLNPDTGRWQVDVFQATDPPVSLE